MRRVIFCVLIFLVVCIIGINIAYAQSGLKMFTSGYVRDKDTNKPIVGAEVVLINENTDEIFHGLSDEHGFYEIGFLEPGEYHFSIGPEEGSGIFIGVAGENSMDSYKLKIVEGKNAFLNFFLGKSDHIYFNREDTKAGIINFTMAYTDIDAEFTNKSDTFVHDTSQNETPNQFTFSYYIRNEWIYDLFNGDGKYYFQYEGKYHAKCTNRLCYYEARGFLVGQIWMHTTEWYKQKRPNDDKLECFIGCLRDHENLHKEDSITIGRDLFRREVIDKSKLDICCKHKDCGDNIIKYLEKWKELCYDYMREGGPSEQRAIQAQNSCDSKCRGGNI
jgi:hypothetical protein